MERENSPAAGLNEARLRNTLQNGRKGPGRIRNALVNCGWDYSDRLAIFFLGSTAGTREGLAAVGPVISGFDIAIL